MKLTDPSDEQLNAAFAEKVAGWTRIPQIGQWPDRWSCGDDVRGRPPHFTVSPTAVLPWLEKAAGVEIKHAAQPASWADEWQVGVLARYKDVLFRYSWSDKSLARAAVMALLLAHGVEVEFTK